MAIPQYCQKQTLTQYHNTIPKAKASIIKANPNKADLGGSLAVASKGLFATGVSTDLSVTYLASGGKAGDLLRAEVTCDKFGRSLAYTSIKFLNSKDELVARGSHTKYIRAAFKDVDGKNKLDEFSPELK